MLAEAATCLGVSMTLTTCDRYTPKRVLLAMTLTTTLLATGGCVIAPPHSPYTSVMVGKLSGVNEVPPVATRGTGVVDTTYDRQTSILRWTVTYSGLTGPVTSAHFHGPAQQGASGGITVPLVGSLLSPISGAATLNTVQAADLIAGRWYLNLHTAANPGGEIRGQIMYRP
jgi:CHRD domain